ncbi:hypothetical protein SAMN06265348_12018 [Pedobacter westerhofensis]|uniref:Uncharacterized protein n=1 Tax=Pedobacter westerhofensis TaxID=425512 RepID=A0A521FUC4_9SPHI|nr:hypothetical protein SAMN06265348_12018 [Pedobacter westerhofensis]
MSILNFVQKRLIKFLPLNVISADQTESKRLAKIPVSYQSHYYENDASLIINFAKPVSMNINYGK